MQFRHSLFVAVLVLVIFGCKKDNTVPAVSVSLYYPNIEADAQLNTLITPYNAKMVTGGYKGNGILIYRLKKDYAIDDFIAFDRTCPYEADTQRFYWSNKNPQICRCPTCGTTYNLVGGYLEKGPSKYPPRRFVADFVDGDLHVHN